MKTAFLFPGQGAQFVGMGKDIAEAFPQADAVFNKANEIVGYDLKTFCFEGPEEKLNCTAISQPAIFTVSAAILETIRTSSVTADLQPDVAAGLSMGEYSALYAGGLISFEAGLKLVKRRGEAMQAAADASDGAMLAVIGLDVEKVQEMCKEAGENELLVGVNFNCPGQIVLSGTKAACARAEAIAEKYGAAKAVPLAVAGAFHTEMMSTAAEELAGALETTNISDPSEVKTISNINGEYYTTVESIRTGLTKQLTEPILWQKCMERLIADGVEDFYEIGPGKVLTGLMRRINRKQKVVNVSNLPGLNKLFGR